MLTQQLLRHVGRSEAVWCGGGEDGGVRLRVLTDGMVEGVLVSEAVQRPVLLPQLLVDTGVSAGERSHWSRSPLYLHSANS